VVSADVAYPITPTITVKKNLAFFGIRSQPMLIGRSTPQPDGEAIT
jgi:hypothetical protein